MNTSVVQLFTTKSPDHSTWIKRITGVACFVRDSSKRSYFIQVFCLAKHELFWEEEMYKTIILEKPCEYLITFEGKVSFIFIQIFILLKKMIQYQQNCMIALNFAFEDEASGFHKCITEVINRSSQRPNKTPKLYQDRHQIYNNFNGTVFIDFF